MPQNTRAFSVVKIIYFILGLIFAAFIYYISTNLQQDTFLRNLLRDAAYAIVIAEVGIFVTSLTRRLFDAHAAETNKVMEITQLWQKFGITNMAPKWQEFKSPTGIGLEFRSLLKKQFRENATWYIVTINPEGFADDFFNSVILPALARGVRLKWAYVALPDKDDRDRKVLRDLWASQYVAWVSDVEQNLSFAKDNLSNSLNKIELLVEQEIESQHIPPDALEIYESQIPTTFLGFLAVKRVEDSHEEIPTNNLLNDISGIALINPYTILPASPKDHWGMLLKSPGKLYLQYATSIIDFFVVGQRRKYLHRIWPKT